MGLLCGGKKAIAGKKSRETRTEICEGCQFFDTQQRTCLVCGCYTDLKVLMATEACPAGKWGRDYFWRKAIDREEGTT